MESVRNVVKGFEGDTYNNSRWSSSYQGCTLLFLEFLKAWIFII